MSKKLLFKLVALVACLLCSLGSAAAEAYANINFATASMTFYYDDLRSTRTGKTYDLNGAMYTPGWYNDGNYVYVEKVSFDSSFAVVYPRATDFWFAGMTLRYIYGLEYLNTSAVTNMECMFSGCKITGSSPDLSHFNTANVTDMGSMFSGFSCLSSSSLDLSSFNTANVTDMDWMFNNDSTLITITVGEGWNTDAVTSSDRMFLNCTSLVGGKGTTYDANHVDASYAHIDGGTANPGYFTDGREAYACYTPTDSTLTFYYDNLRSTRDGMTYDMNTGKNDPGWCSDNTCFKVTAVVFTSSFTSVRPVSIYHWFSNMQKLRSITGMKEYLNTANVTDMTELFYNCKALTSVDVSGFNTANVTTMSAMFMWCSALTSVDVSSFNTANVESMTNMFYGCNYLATLDLSSFNTANVKNMKAMFCECNRLTSLDVSNFNTANVIAMDYMFDDCYALTSLDVSSFNTSKVTDFRRMFAYCTHLTSLDVSNFNTDMATNMQDMFLNCMLLTTLDLSNFNTAKVTDMSYLFFKCNKLTTIYVGQGWSTDIVTSSDAMFEFCTNLVGGQGTTYDANYVDKAYAHIDGGPSNPGYFTEKLKEAYACYTPSNTTLTFYYDYQKGSRSGMTYDLNTPGYFPDWQTDGTCSSVTQVAFDPSFADARPNCTEAWFYGMNYLESITGMNNLNTDSVQNMFRMFADCQSLTSLDLSGFNTSNVKNTAYMFCNCLSLTSLDVSGFNTSNVTSMAYMFRGCRGLTSLDLRNFNTSEVSDMSSMFEFCDALENLDVSNFNTSKVRDMSRMFSTCIKLTSLDLSSFNTSWVENMERMFYFSKMTTIYVSDKWNVSLVASSANMFTNCTNLVGGQGTTYSSGHVDKTYAHIDGGPDNPGYFTAEGAQPWTDLEAYACYTSDNTTLTFYYDNLRSTRPGTTYDLNEGYDFPGWYSDGSNSSVTQAVFDPSFADARPTTTCGWFNNMKKLENITGMEYLNTSQVTKMSYMFYFCTSLTSLDLSNFNTANVTDMSRMFYQCRMTSLDLSNFNTANVTSMDYMFNYCLNLISLDVSGFNTAKVTDMEGMFNRCSSLTTIYGGDGWITSAVENSRMMFYNCTSLVGGQGTTYDVNHVDKAYAHIDGGPSNPGYLSAKPEPYANYTPDNTTLTFYYDGQRGNRPGMTYDLNTGNNIADWYDIRASVTKVVFDQLFADARPTTTSFWFCGMDNLSSITGMQYLNTSSVTSMDFMFYACSSLTELDLSSFNTESVKSMNSMLAYCRNLTSIYAGDGWTTDGVTTSNNMFISSYSLVGGMGTTYDASHVDKAYAHIDGGPSNPGYFTEKVDFLRGDVNGDGQVKIGDVTAQINYLLSGDASGINAQAADVNGDGQVKIGDVTALINYLLSGSWN